MHMPRSVYILDIQIVPQKAFLRHLEQIFET